MPVVELRVESVAQQSSADSRSTLNQASQSDVLCCSEPSQNGAPEGSSPYRSRVLVVKAAFSSTTLQDGRPTETLPVALHNEPSQTFPVPASAPPGRHGNARGKIASGIEQARTRSVSRPASIPATSSRG
jgi:hypothetical protein